MTRAIWFCAAFCLLLTAAQDDDSSTPAPEDANARYCYKYSWKGPVTDQTNSSESCATLDAWDIPCQEPIVWTEGSNAMNGPDPEELEQACEDGLTIDGQTCDPKCLKADQTCIKMTYYRIGGSRTVENYTSFCGKGYKDESGEEIKTGCYTQENVDGVDVEVCFCDNDRCNGAPTSLVSLGSAVALLVALATAALAS